MNAYLGTSRPTRRIAETSWVTVYWVATASAKIVESTAGAYASAAAFVANDAVTRARALADVPVRVATGYDDPFYPGVQALARALPPGAVVDLAKGCHTNAFFAGLQPPSLAS